MNEHTCERKPEFVQIKRYVRFRCGVPVWWLHIEHRAVVKDWKTTEAANG